MAWGVPLISAIQESTGGNITLAEHGSAAQGQLQVAFIAYRSTNAFSPPAGTDWALCATQQSSGDTDATNGVASAVMYWRLRPAAAGDLVFTRAAGTAVAQGVILSYPVTAGTVPAYVTGSANTLGSVNVTVTTGTFNTSTTGELIVCGCSVGDNFNVENFDAATDPAAGSGTSGPDTTTAPTAGTWLERVDTGTGTGADSGIAVGDAIRATAGATGTIQCTSASACRSAMVAACFKMVAGPQTVNATAVATALTMPNAGITVGAITVAATAVALALTIPNPTITSALTVQATPVALALTVPDASVTVGAVTIQATTCGLTLTIPNVGITYDQAVQATAVALGLTIPDAGITTGPVTLTATPVALALAMPDATVTPGAVTVQGSAATIALAVPDVTISTGPITIQATSVELALTVPDPTISRGAITAQATAVALTLTVSDAVITSGGQVVSATAVGLALAVPDAGITVGPVTLQATPVALALAVGDATLTPGPLTVAATPASLTLTIPDSQIFTGQIISATSADLTLTVSDPTVTVGAAPAAGRAGFGASVLSATFQRTPGGYMNTLFRIKAGNLGPSMEVTLYRPDGQPQNLTGATVRLVITRPNGLQLFDRPVSAITDEAGGIVRYDWQVGDTATPGRYTAEIDAVIGGVPLTYPNNRHLVVLMAPSMGDQAVQATAASLTLTVPDPTISQA